jgi:hypothetical protein
MSKIGVLAAVFSSGAIPLRVLPAPELEMALEQNSAWESGVEGVQEVMGEDSIGKDRRRLPLPGEDTGIEPGVLRTKPSFPAVLPGPRSGRAHRTFPSV